jgi:maltose alpha-D-glucosyltransferase/alpha-amylase
MSLPTLCVNGGWETLLGGRASADFCGVLSEWLTTQRWFPGKGRAIRRVTIVDAVAIPTAAGGALVTLVEVRQPRSAPETYMLPVAFAAGAGVRGIRARHPGLAIARIESGDARPSGILFDAMADAGFARALFESALRQRTFEGNRSRIECSSSAAFAGSASEGSQAPVPRLSTAEQSNTTIRFGRRFILKLYRRPMPGTNPDLEIGRALTARRFPHTPPLLGAIEHRAAGVTRTLAVMHRLVPGATDGWEFALGELARFFERVRKLGDPPRLLPHVALGELMRRARAVSLRDILGDLFDASVLLGKRIAELHTALAAISDDPDFAPEPLDAASMRELSRSFVKSAAEVFRQVASRAPFLPRKSRRLALAILAERKRIIGTFRRIATFPPSGSRIRIHGDLHLGQTLRTRRDFYIIDFEGEPSAPLDERRRKQSPLHDVAGMLRSFDYAVHAALRRTISEGTATAAGVRNLRAWAAQAAAWMSGNFLAAYHAHPGIATLLPASADDDEPLLQPFLLRKALYEVAYELNHRPGWLDIPCRGVLTMIGGAR